MRIFGFIALCIWLLSSATVQQFYKLPELLSHFQDHKLVQEDLNFSEFLFMHYIGSDDTDADDQKDATLPFKTSEENSNPTEIIFSALCFQNIERIEIKSLPELEICCHDKLTSRPDDEVFRPPLL